MKSIFYIALKELQDGLRNRWLLAISLLFVMLAAGIAWFGAAAAGQVGFSSISSTIASLASLATFIIPLIALLLAYDAIVGEDEGGTLLLLLTYPLGKRQLLLGKFVGQGLILALATLIGFGGAALAIGLLVPDIDKLQLFVAFGRFIASAILLGWVFIAMAYVLSSRAREKSSAAGMALGIWFLFVLVFDLALLALLVLSKGQLNPDWLPWLLLLNPADIFRQLNLSGLDGSLQLSGVMSLGQDLAGASGTLWAALLGWMVLCLVLAQRSFMRRSI
ncbi:ABC transporter permease [Bowmanella sp. Y26]|uniref:ABC transporter permease n=1 Tax=Bowmanella yangjiangensis TaxID=2811230 RepID=UPI001BDC9A16|nr:ABC transporter permease subunit [Bowmanella yangjiangensis]MBT1063405.1 ABC transporter permease [Bowmanella yangjiangensis]